MKLWLSKGVWIFFLIIIYNYFYSLLVWFYTLSSYLLYVTLLYDCKDKAPSVCWFPFIYHYCHHCMWNFPTIVHIVVRNFFTPITLQLKQCQMFCNYSHLLQLIVLCSSVFNVVLNQAYLDTTSLMLCYFFTPTPISIHRIDLYYCLINHVHSCLACIRPQTSYVNYPMLFNVTNSTLCLIFLNMHVYCVSILLSKPC